MKKIIFTLFLLGAVLTSNAQLTIFSDSPDNTKYLASWGQQNVVLNGANVPVTTAFKHSGTNALQIEYNAGYWQLHIFKTMNLTTATGIEMWLYSENEIAAITLPQTYFMQNSSNTPSTAVGLGNVIGTLPANTWKKASIPISSFGNVANLADLKSISFGQNNWAAGVYGKLIVDDIVALGVASGLETNATKKITLTYVNDILSLSDYNGEVYIYSATGKSIGKLDMVNGKASAKLMKGIYLVQTGIGTGKVLVK